MSAKPPPDDINNSRSVVRGLSDWLELLSGPPTPVFTEILSKKDWNRMLRALVLSLSFSAVALGITFSLAGLLSRPSEMMLASKPIIFALLSGAFLATLYTLISPIFRIKLTLQQAFFIILSLCLPWLPLLIFVEAIKYLPSFPLISLIYIFGAVIVIYKAMSNFVRGVAEVTSCPKWRVWLSVLAPTLITVLLVFRMYG